MLASAFMTVVVPKVAGVERVVACAPPRDGAGHPPGDALRDGAPRAPTRSSASAASRRSRRWRSGSASVEPVDMIVGAGNAYVAEAKRQLFGRVGIDLLAGPTEILVIADDGADPELVAADLLGQAEHGPTSPAVLVTHVARRSAQPCRREVERLLARLADARRSPARPGATHGEIVVVARPRRRRSSSPTATRTSTSRCTPPRTSSTPTSTACATTARCSSAREATVAYGDKAVGTNHVLPTAGAARYTGGLWVGKFLKTRHLPAAHRRGHAAGRARGGGDLGRRAVRAATRSRRGCGSSDSTGPGSTRERARRPDRARHRAPAAASAAAVRVALAEAGADVVP